MYPAAKPTAPKFKPTKGLPVIEAVTNQYSEEARDLKHDQDFMLKQKYGLVSPQLELAEINEIRREARFGTR